MSFFSRIVRQRFCSDIPAVIGAGGVGVLFLTALLAPFLANGRPFLVQETDGSWQLPF